jgi:hypothetical protein
VTAGGGGGEPPLYTSGCLFVSVGGRACMLLLGGCLLSLAMKAGGNSWQGLCVPQ